MYGGRFYWFCAMNITHGIIIFTPLVTNITMCKHSDVEEREGNIRMDSNTMSDKKQSIISTTWNYLLETGLNNASIGDLCRGKKLSQSSLYYWFDNKDDIWVNAGKYGLSRVVDALFAFTINHTNEIRQFFDTFLDEIEKYKYELRLAVQITSSVVYGDRLREESKNFRLLYERYAEKLMGVFGCTYQQAEVFIYSIIAIVIDYAIWDDSEKTQMLLDNLYERVMGLINK